MKYIISLLVFLTFSCSFKTDPKSNALKGVLDLSHWDFSENVPLNGEWEFYWKKFYYPEDFRKEKTPDDRMWAPVPEIFNRIIEGNNGVGYATYRLLLILPENEQNYSFYIKRMPTSYRLFINGELIHEVGIAGTNKESSYPVYSCDQVNLFQLKMTNEIIFHSANYYDRAGGLWKQILLGTEKNITRTHIKNIEFNVAFLVLFFFLSIYHFMQFITGIKKQSTIMLGILCLMLGFRVFVMDEMLILKILPQIYSRDLMRMEFISFFSIIPILHLFIYTLYKDLMSKTLTRIQFILSGTLDIITLFTPTLFYVNFMDPYKLIIFISLIYLIVVTVKAVKMKKPGAALSLTGLLAFTSAVIVDIVVFTVNYESDLNLTPYGMLGIVFFESITIFRQLSESNKLADKLALELRESIAQEQQLNKMKNHFITHASHEFRTPLAVIQLSAETLERVPAEKLKGEKRSRYFSQIQNSVRQITDIMDNILTLGRQQSPHQTMIKKELDLEAFLRNIINNSFPDGDRIKLSVRGKPFPYAIDSESFGRAIINLISNAVKFSSQDKSIEIFLEYLSSKVKITVRDFGIGIPEQEQEHIFDDFYRGSNTGDIKGSGLGLSITKNIVEKHGGKITVESLPGSYTRFVVTLP